MDMISNLRHRTRYPDSLDGLGIGIGRVMKPYLSSNGFRVHIGTARHKTSPEPTTIPTVSRSQWLHLIAYSTNARPRILASTFSILLGKLGDMEREQQAPTWGFELESNEPFHTYRDATFGWYRLERIAWSTYPMGPRWMPEWRNSMC
jgi:hypothetical protein